MDILAFDTETTSEKPETCRVCQVAAVLISPGTDTDVEDVYPWLDEITDPGLESSDGATAIHGIGPEQWAGKRLDHVALCELYDRIESEIVQRTIDEKELFAIAGHNIRWFDLPILYRVTDRPAIHGLPVIDTMVCAQRLYPLAPSHRLTTNPNQPEKTGLIEWLQLGDVVGAHSAVGDAMMVYRLVRHFMDGLGKTPLELANWCSEIRILKTCHFGRHKGKLWGKPKEGEDPILYVPSGQAWWISQNFSPAPDLEATIKKHYGYTFKYHFRR